MEVLISMGVLAVGLLGVAALIPAGRYQIAQGSRLEYSAMVGRSAFREMQIRGYLNPKTWYTASGTALWDPAGGGMATPFVDVVGGGGGHTDEVAVAIDPLGIVAGYGNNLPSGITGARSMARIAPFDPTPANARFAADVAFRSSLDLITEPNTTNAELPPTQFFFMDASSNRLRRGSEGSYSWMATITSDPTKAYSANPASSAYRGEMIVSVAVFQKRNLSGAGAGEVRLTNIIPPSVSGTELHLTGLGTRTVKPGEWLLVAITRGAITRFDWYRVLLAQQPDGGNQWITLQGRTLSFQPGDITDVWLFDNLVGVYQKTMPLEIE